MKRIICILLLSFCTVVSAADDIADGAGLGATGVKSATNPNNINSAMGHINQIQPQGETDADTKALVSQPVDPSQAGVENPLRVDVQNRQQAQTGDPSSVVESCRRAIAGTQAAGTGVCDNLSGNQGNSTQGY